MKSGPPCFESLIKSIGMGLKIRLNRDPTGEDRQGWNVSVGWWLALFAFSASRAAPQISDLKASARMGSVWPYKVRTGGWTGDTAHRGKQDRASRGRSQEHGKDIDIL